MKPVNEFNKIRLWAHNHGIYQFGDHKTQLIKLQEEVGELAKAVLTDNRNEIVDAIGDCVIVLTSLAQLAELHFSRKCTTCRGIGGDFDYTAGDGKGLWIECKDCGKIDIETCIKKAFKEVKGRTGAMSNGTFIKNK